MSRQNEYFDWIDREGIESSREHYDRQYDRFVPPLQETETMTKVDPKLKSKQIDKLVEAAFKQYGNGVQIPMMSIPDIYKAGHDAYAAGQDIKDAVKAAVENLRKN